MMHKAQLYPNKLTVWCTFYAGGVIDPFFVSDEGGASTTVKVDRYGAVMYLGPVQRYELGRYVVPTRPSCDSELYHATVLADGRLVCVFNPIRLFSLRLHEIAGLRQQAALPWRTFGRCRIL